VREGKEPTATKELVWCIGILEQPVKKMEKRTKALS
jgi:hypothetical protein